MNYSPPSKRGRPGPPDTSDVLPFREVPYVERLEDAEPQRSEQEQSSIDFVALLGALWRRRMVILAVLVIGLSASVFLTLRETPVYRAKTTLEVQARETQIIQGSGLDGGGVADAEFMGTQLALLESRALAERVAESIDLVSDPNYVNPAASRETRLSQAANAVLAGLSVSNVRGARIIEISFVSTRPAETSRVANAVAEDFIQMNLERRYNATAYARQFIEERLATTKTALEETERSLVAYSKEQEILDLSSVGGSDIGSSLDASSLVSINASLTEAQNTRILAEQRYREAANNPSTLEIEENEVIQALRRQRAELLSDYQQRLNTYKPDFPEMQQLAARIDTVEAEIERERSNFIGALEATYRSSVAREQALAKRVSELKTDVLDLRGRSIDYNILRREADTLRAQYDALLQRYKEISIVSGVGSSQVSVLDLAQAPTFPFSPDVGGELSRALIFSIFFAVALAMLVEFVDDTIKTPDDISRKLGLRILGVIPKFRGRKTVPELLKDPRSPLSEAFASARTAVQFAMTANSVKSILVTAGRAAEGKSSTTLALATSFAAVGHRVLIIDADMRRPSFSYDKSASIGLSGILSENTVLAGEVLAGPAENLFLLPAGKEPPNPAELLGSTRIVHIIQQAMETYDVVIVDSPPAEGFADALALSAVCDATVLVLQSGSVHRQTARRTVDRLRSANAVMLGCILTKFDNKRYGYGNSYGYGYKEYERANRKRVGATAASSRRQISYFRESSRESSRGDDAPNPPDLFE